MRSLLFLYGIKSVFEVQPKIEKINPILAVLCERTVDTTLFKAFQ